ncbi:LuxR family transcriptional regulator (plasmid) [Polymorphobacter sp. PAMC 29334]|uniref:helix-turn-helix transcriptional regulator n=1 Tax=Polymorphobacter sp. PAMC 29334 TaxID=2862331 RepID=UPI001C668358|nr:LuxR family transcriptional regulator [Polymorphobacter sp. PAMC 29334]QYE33080.1 LuxR family transcriptional regulator [Polymorphobacter sp. PAMC 29334]
MIAQMPSDAADMLASARGIGFDKCIYGIDEPDGVIDPPWRLTGSGLTDRYRSEYLDRVNQDPMRRMVARGEIVVANTPIVWENDGSRLSISPDRRLSASDTAMLRWFLAQGMRTGIAFRIRMPQGRCASINFFSASEHTADDLDRAMQVLFLIGHRLHARLEPTSPEPRDKLLSRRESECLEWIARGLGNRQIADTLGLSVDTVKEHVHSLFIKLKATSRAHAVTRGHSLSYLD